MAFPVITFIEMFTPKRPIWMSSGDKSGWDACYCYIYLWLGTECQMAISLSIGKFTRMLSKSLGSNILLNNRKNMAVQGEKCADNDAIPLWRLLLHILYFLPQSIFFILLFFFLFRFFFSFWKIFPGKETICFKNDFHWIFFLLNLPNFVSICIFHSDSELEELETTPRYRPDSLSALSRSTRFSEAEIKRIYRGFKAECPTGVVKEDTFKIIYSQFFPQGGLYAYF